MTGPVRTTTVARCYWAGHDQPTGCGWTHPDPGADRAAEKHTKTTQHGTTVDTRPTEEDA